MNASIRSKHPCLHREAFPPWENDHLYIGDSGHVRCGRCMGIESTYTPWAFSDLGRMDAERKVVLRVPPLSNVGEGPSRPVPTTFRCDTDDAYRRKLATQRRDA